MRDNDDPQADTAMEPPEDVKEQFRLWDQRKGTIDVGERTNLLKRVLKISEEQFHVMGVAPPSPKIVRSKNTLRNTPELMPLGWSFPRPAPTNFEQFSTLSRRGVEPQSFSEGAPPCALPSRRSPHG